MCYYFLSTPFLHHSPHSSSSHIKLSFPICRYSTDILGTICIYQNYFIFTPSASHALSVRKTENVVQISAGLTPIQEIVSWKRITTYVKRKIIEKVFSFICPKSLIETAYFPRAAGIITQLPMRIKAFPHFRDLWGSHSPLFSFQTYIQTLSLWTQKKSCNW